MGYEVFMKVLSMLGLRVEDKVTGLRGVITSITFDLYGCIQALVHPGMDKNGDLLDLKWFDINRIEILDTIPVMDTPDFELDGPATEHFEIPNWKNGPSEKPKFYKY